MNNDRYFLVQHLTHFQYSHPVCESVLEIRMQPATTAVQQCHRFDLLLDPPAIAYGLVDQWGTWVHQFNVLPPHLRLEIQTQALVQLRPAPLLPTQLPMSAWEEVDRVGKTAVFFDYTHPSHFVQFTPQLHAFAEVHQLHRHSDPLTLLHQINNILFTHFHYAPNATRVDSPIDDILSARRGVCQDYSHVMLALCRRVGLPSRYVSGYLFHQSGEDDISTPSATHAWVETWLPNLGWVGFDPTNHLIVHDRHIVVGVGRDYQDVAPARGVYTGAASSQLEVAVSVTPAVGPTTKKFPMLATGWAMQQQQQSQQ